MYHFNQSKASTKKHEPVYLTKFEVTFVLPEPLRAIYGGEIISEQLKSINGLNLDKLPGPIEQAYRFHKRRFAGSIVDTNIDLDMKFEVNVDEQLVMYPYNVFKAWSRLIYDPQTGFQSLKKDYTGQLTIKIHNKVGNVLREIFFPMIFPIKPINEWSLDYKNEAHYDLDIAFAAENPTDLIVGNTTP